MSFYILFNCKAIAVNKMNGSYLHFTFIMTIQEIYNLAIKMGIESDFREEKEIKKILERLKEKYDKINEQEKQELDIERLKNPYTDTRILFGDSKKQVKKVLIGIDIDGEELLLADKWGDIDLIISHHPRGKALAGLDDVMQLQIDVLAQYGVPINIAEKLLKKRMAEAGSLFYSKSMLFI